MIVVAAILREVGEWLERRAAAAPTALADAYHKRAKLYFHSIGCDNQMTQRLFRMSINDPDFDGGRIPQNLIEPEGAAPTSLIGPPDTLHVRLEGELGTFDVAELSEQIARATNIVMHINCCGGDAFGGFKLFGCLVGRGATGIVADKAWSAGAIALLGCDKRIAKRSATIMLHRGHCVCFGDSQKLRETADANDKLVGLERQILAARTGQPAEIVNGWLDGEDHYFTAEQALAAGLVHAIEP